MIDSARAAALFQRLLDGDDSAELLDWLRAGAAALWHHGIPLENALFLPGGGRRLRLVVRDRWLREAAKHVDARSQIGRCRALLAAGAGAPCSPAVRLCLDRAAASWPLPASVSTLAEILSGDSPIGRQKLRRTA